MATIKSYADIEQSKKLAEILPIESADMAYYFWKKNGNIANPCPFILDGTEVRVNGVFTYLNCWSLAALLSVLPDYTLQTNSDGTVFVVCDSKKPMISDAYDNPVDACVAMVESLNEFNLL